MPKKKPSKQDPEEHIAAVFVSLDEIQPNEKNPRNNDHAVSKVARSIQRFGFASPIIVNELDKKIIAGHTRYKAAKELGLDKVPVRFIKLDPVEAQLLTIADNKIGEVADWNERLLQEILSNIDDNEDLTDFGFDQEELDALLSKDDAEFYNHIDQELSLDDFEKFNHTCPRCNFEWND